MHPAAPSDNPKQRQHQPITTQPTGTQAMATIDDYKTFLETIRKQTGLDMLVPDDDGLLSFRVDDEYNINLQFL